MGNRIVPQVVGNLWTTRHPVVTVTVKMIAWVTGWSMHLGMTISKSYQAIPIDGIWIKKLKTEGNFCTIVPTTCILS